MRTPRIKEDGAGYYHVISRVVDRRKVFEEPAGQTPIGPRMFMRRTRQGMWGMQEKSKSPADRAGEVRLSGPKPAAPKPKPFDPQAIGASKELDHVEEHWKNAPVKVTQGDLATAHKDPLALKTIFRHKQQGGGHAPDVVVRPTTRGRYEVRIPRRLLNLIPYTAVRIVDEDGNFIKPR